MRSNSGRSEAAVKPNPYGAVEVMGKGDWKILMIGVGQIRGQAGKN
jgi:hypothetical protein